ncbi:MAG: hypothetical protein ACM3NN_08385, partial [Nitrospirota bacterium]
LCRSAPSGSIETRSLPTLTRCHPRSFAFYVADASAPFAVARMTWIFGTTKREWRNHVRWSPFDPWLFNDESVISFPAFLFS